MASGGFVGGGGGSFVGGGGGGFVESQHPRDAHGEFTGTGGSKHTGGFKPKGGAARAAPPKVTVQVSKSDQGVLDRILGQPVTAKDLQGLLGAPSGAHVSVDTKSGGHPVFIVTHSLYEQPHISALVDLGGGRKMMQLELFHLKPTAPKGMGTTAFQSMTENARRLGIEAIHIPEAARVDSQRESERMVGYYVWPLFGADGKIPADKQGQLPESLKGSTHLSQLMATEEGSAWWKANGKTVACTFLTAPDSVSSQAFSRYLAKRASKKAN